MSETESTIKEIMDDKQELAKSGMLTSAIVVGAGAAIAIPSLFTALTTTNQFDPVNGGAIPIAMGVVLFGLSWMVHIRWNDGDLDE